MECRRSEVNRSKHLHSRRPSQSAHLLGLECSLFQADLRSRLFELGLCIGQVGTPLPSNMLIAISTKRAWWSWFATCHGEVAVSAVGESRCRVAVSIRCVGGRNFFGLRQIQLRCLFRWFLKPWKLRSFRLTGIIFVFRRGHRLDFRSLKRKRATNCDGLIEIVSCCLIRCYC